MESFLSYVMDSSSFFKAYYSAIRKKKILPFAAAQMDLGNLMLNEISQSKKTNTIWFHTYVESNEQTELASKVKTVSWRAGWQLWGWGLGVEGSSKKEKGLMTMDNSVVIVEGEGQGEGYKGDGWWWKKYSKNKFNKKSQP